MTRAPSGEASPPQSLSHEASPLDTVKWSGTILSEAQQNEGLERCRRCR